MKCPKCGKDMESGFLQCGSVVDNIVWVSKLLPLGFGSWKKDAVIVSDEKLGIGIAALP